MLVTGAVVAAVLATLVGIFGFSTIPRDLGLYRFLASQNDAMVGLTPAFHHGIPWKFTWEEFYQHDLTGKTAMVTGANSGIGFDLAESLAKAGASVILVCRNPKKCQTAKEQIIQSNKPKGTISALTMDTASLASVRSMAETFVQEYASTTTNTKIDLMFFNAGTLIPVKKNECPPRTEADDIDYHFQVNYLGHHLLYHLLKPYLAEHGRIIQTSSGNSFQTPSYKVATNLETLHECINHFTSGTYGQSKLAQVLWVKKLTRILGPSSTQVANVFGPGMVNTPVIGKITADMSSWEQSLFGNFMATSGWQSPDGALTGLYLAVTKNDTVRGKYFHPMAQEVVNPDSLDETLQDDLWEFSNQLVEAYMTPIVQQQQQQQQQPAAVSAEGETTTTTSIGGTVVVEEKENQKGAADDQSPSEPQEASSDADEEVTPEEAEEKGTNREGGADAPIAEG